ncbi:MAG: UbiX family flavin prenyltransferase [Pseudomonadota bacterium]
MSKTANKRIIVGISGASGIAYGIRLLRFFQGRDDCETHLVVSENAEKLVQIEGKMPPGELRKLAAHCWAPYDFEAPIASGTFKTGGMVVAPCSIKTLSAVANSYGENLLARAADVTLKERRPLVLIVRETPLHSGHLELMLKASRMGAVILPPSPGFYSGPVTIEDLVDQIAGKALDILGIENDIFARWNKP